LLKTIYPQLEALYIGYDNHNCRLNEPSLEKTKGLIMHLEPSAKPEEIQTGARIGKIRCKTIRPAWWEKHVS